MPAAAIDLQHIKFSWPGAPALLEIERLQVERGERVFLRGPSGSGKSTLLGLIGGVLAPNAGSVRVLDQPLHDMSAAERDRFRGEHVGFVFQMFNLVPYLSVRENVLLALRFAPARAARVNSRGEEAGRLLAAMGLADPALLDRPVTQLSIGQQQRVAAARALLGGPELLVADEPTSALDHDAREAFLRRSCVNARRMARRCCS
ncbi:MAG TPA: ATP-binding cassette domain-containing protein [Steroidobacteraceae bacterium]|nr:ATP-binding cassette domain-containing protein [Steroidobacteraceae bacterium]